MNLHCDFSKISPLCARDSTQPEISPSSTTQTLQPSSMRQSISAFPAIGQKTPKQEYSLQNYSFALPDRRECNPSIKEIFFNRYPITNSSTNNEATSQKLDGFPTHHDNFIVSAADLNAQADLSANPFLQPTELHHLSDASFPLEQTEDIKGISPHSSDTFYSEEQTLNFESQQPVDFGYPIPLEIPFLNWLSQPIKATEANEIGVGEEFPFPSFTCSVTPSDLPPLQETRQVTKKTRKRKARTKSPDSNSSMPTQPAAKRLKSPEIRSSSARPAPKMEYIQWNANNKLILMAYICRSQEKRIKDKLFEAARILGRGYSHLYKIYGRLGSNHKLLDEKEASFVIGIHECDYKWDKFALIHYQSTDETLIRECQQKYQQLLNIIIEAELANKQI